jgi:hypothetical protein
VHVERLIVSGSGDGDIVASVHEPQAEHCIQSELNDIADPHARFEEAFECGDELFEVRFNALDGVGANVGDGQRFTRTPRADKKGPGEWATHTPPRATGPNAEACNDCHRQPFDDGAGPAAQNVTRDPLQSADLGKFINRNTPHLFAPGALQLLAEEMTAVLHQARDDARQRSCDQNGRPVRAKLEAKGIDFGSIRVRCNGNDDNSRITGVDADLIIKPFQWKGSNTTVRDFNRGAAHNELGMQAVEITGEDVDGDGDGVVNELGVGDITALAIYNAAQPRPVTKLELAALGLMEVSAEEQAAIENGEEVFNRVGCADCHRPALVLDNPVFSEPSQNPSFRDAPFPAGQDPLSLGLDPDNAVVFDFLTDPPDNVIEVGGQTVRLGALEPNPAGGAVVRLFGDLKRHDMGSGLAENIDEVGSGASVWITKELWGVGSTAPYLHDGRATTLMEAILEHGGEARRSRARAARLSTSDQADLVAFLNNLILFKIEEEG